MMAEFFVGLQKVFSSLRSLPCSFFGEFFSFLQERATPVCLTENACVGVQHFSVDPIRIASPLGGMG